jgi:hypothetical protein
MFMAFNASLADQFEVIQMWLNGGNSTGLPSARRDPLLGALEDDDDSIPFTFHDTAGEALCVPVKPCVQLLWGLYLLYPSLSTLRRLEAFAAGARPDVLALRDAEALLLQLEAGDARAAREPSYRPIALQQWKAALEDLGSLEGSAQRLWAAIRELRGGVVQCSYGTLVAHSRGVHEVLRDTQRFSARRYWERMQASLGGHHLGLDYDSPEYARQAAALNPFVYAISRHDGYAAATGVARAVIDGLRALELKALTSPPAGTPDLAAANEDPIVDLQRLAAACVAQLSSRWFGLPDGKHMVTASRPDGPGALAYFPGDFRDTSLYIFFPNPEGWTADVAQQAGRAIQDATRAVLRERVGQPLKPRAESSLIDTRLEGFLDAQACVRSLSDEEVTHLAHEIAGTVSGFIVATLGSFLTCMKVWIASGELWRHRTRRLCERATASVESKPDLNDWLMQSIVKTMKLAPTPNLLHRETRTTVPLSELCPAHAHAARGVLSPGERVVAILGSAAADEPDPERSVDILFGGRADPENPTQGQLHACPGKEMALGVLYGMIDSILTAPDVLPAGPLSLAFPASAFPKR